MIDSELHAILLLLGTAGGFALLTHLHFSHRRRVKAKRGAAYNRCLDLFSRYRVEQDDVDYPILNGEYQGHRVQLKLIADHVGYRKVPSLWLQVTVFDTFAWSGTLDYLVRPQNIEFYSPSSDLPIELPIPAHWPQYATLRTNDNESIPALHLLDSTLELFEKPAMKEVLVSPRGSRLVCQIDQAQRREYLVLRAVGFENDQLEAAHMSSLLDTLIALNKTLAASPSSAPSYRSHSEQPAGKQFHSRHSGDEQPLGKHLPDKQSRNKQPHNEHFPGANLSADARAKPLKKPYVTAPG